jgi:hypothetical protein
VSKKTNKYTAKGKDDDNINQYNAEKDFVFDVYLFEGQLEDRTQVAGSDPVMTEASDESFQ